MMRYDYFALAFVWLITAFMIAWFHEMTALSLILSLSLYIVGIVFLYKAIKNVRRYRGKNA